MGCIVTDTRLTRLTEQVRDAATIMQRLRSNEPLNAWPPELRLAAAKMIDRAESIESAGSGMRHLRLVQNLPPS